jgi:HSP20 family protein
MARRWDARPAEVDAPRALPVDVREQDEAYLLTTFVPGLKAEDINIQIIEDTLTIEGEYGQHEGQALMSELPSGAFRRALRLPAQLDAEKAEAKIENGILTLRIPKAESARPRVIKVASK